MKLLLKEKFTKFAKNIQKKIKKVTNSIKKNVVDVYFILGLTVLIINSCTINMHFGMYLLSAVFILLSYLSSKK